MLDFLFQGDREAVEEYSEALEDVKSRLCTKRGTLLLNLNSIIDCNKNRRRAQICPRIVRRHRGVGERGI